MQGACWGHVIVQSLKRKPDIISPERLQENNSPNGIAGSDQREEEESLSKTSEAGADFLHDHVQTLRIFVQHTGHVSALFQQQKLRCLSLVWMRNWQRLLLNKNPR
jgi:hypothetical protein